MTAARGERAGAAGPRGGRAWGAGIRRTSTPPGARGSPPLAADTVRLMPSMATEPFTTT